MKATTLAAKAVCSLPRLRGRGGERVNRGIRACLPSPCPSPASGGGDVAARALATPTTCLRLGRMAPRLRGDDTENTPINAPRVVVAVAPVAVVLSVPPPRSADLPPPAR